jgi:crossover junction endodeoxyribonuclease RuvC
MIHPVRFAAFDLSLTQTGWATWNGQTSVRGFGTIRPKEMGMARLDRIRREVLTIADGADLVVLEGYSFASKGAAVISLGELGGVVRLSLWATRKHQLVIPPYVDVPPSVAKKLATGRGNAPKEAVLADAIRRLGYTGSNHNEADALWLLEAVLQAYGEGTVELPKVHLAALESIRWPQLRAAA